MPLFSNKFSPKKTPTRRAGVFLANKDLSPKRIEKELGPNVGPIRLKLGEQEAIFDAGLWIPGKILQCSFSVRALSFVRLCVPLVSFQNPAKSGGHTRRMKN